MNREPATLYLHFPCFDGVISGVLAVLFLEESWRWRFETIQPVDYGLKDRWIELALPRRSAVVDFLFHPRAEFWADHHSTTFLTEQLKADFEQGKSSSRLYDAGSGSCASLLWRSFASTLGSDPRLAEMVQWAEKIDSASYQSVQEALSSSAPAMVLSASLAVDADQEYCSFLVANLKQKSLAMVAASVEVQRRFQAAAKMNAAGLERLRDALRMVGKVAVCEVSGDGVLINRYGPYQFYPGALYSVAAIHTQNGVKITAMRNPWIDFESANLGEFMRQFGGGGHQRVGSLILAKDREGETRDVMSRLLRELGSP